MAWSVPRKRCYGLPRRSLIRSSSTAITCRRQRRCATGPSFTVPVLMPGSAIHAYPLTEFLDAGVRVALGTDSLASNPDLSILEEARFVHRQYPGNRTCCLFRMATLAGAEALGCEAETGSLSPANRRMSSSCLFHTRMPANPCDRLQSSLPVRAVLWRGRWTHGSPWS